MMIYISGPMTGLPDNNREAFARAATMLRADPRFTEVISPAELDHAPGATWADFMRRDIEELVKCDAIYLLDGRKTSRGAQLEMQIAEALCMEFFYEEEGRD